MELGVTRNSWALHLSASALAIRVFPVPGGPYISMFYQINQRLCDLLIVAHELPSLTTTLHTLTVINLARSKAARLGTDNFDLSRAQPRGYSSIAEGRSESLACMLMLCTQRASIILSPEPQLLSG